MTEFWRSPRLPQVEARRSCRDSACYRPHTHDRFSIGLIDSGASVFAGPSGPDVRLAAGSVVLIPADHVHSCNPVQAPWRYQMVHVETGWIAPLLPTPTFLDGVRVFHAPDVYEAVRSAAGMLFDGGEAAQVAAAFARALNLLAHRAPDATLGRPGDAELAASLAPVLDRLHEDGATPALDELAALAGLDKYQLVRAVKRATGLSPVAWRHNDRILAARAMLREGRPLAETAHALGFADQSHFTRVFRAHVAAPPGAYQA